MAIEPAWPWPHSFSSQQLVALKTLILIASIWKSCFVPDFGSNTGSQGHLPVDELIVWGDGIKPDMIFASDSVSLQ